MPYQLSLVCPHSPDLKLTARTLAEIINTSNESKSGVEQGTSILYKEVDGNGGGPTDVGNVLLMLNGCSCGNALIELLVAEVVALVLQQGDETVCPLPTTPISPLERDDKLCRNCNDTNIWQK